MRRGGQRGEKKLRSLSVLLRVAVLTQLRSAEQKIEREKEERISNPLGTSGGANRCH